MKNLLKNRKRLWNYILYYFYFLCNSSSKHNVALILQLKKKWLLWYFFKFYNKWTTKIRTDMGNPKFGPALAKLYSKDCILTHWYDLIFHHYFVFKNQKKKKKIQISVSHKLHAHMQILWISITHKYNLLWILVSRDQSI